VPLSRNLRYEIEPNNLRPPLIAADTITIDIPSLALSASRELTQTSPVIMGLGQAIHDLLMPGVSDWRWRGSGPGVGREVRRAMSGLFGRFIARWYLETYHGARAFVPIDRDTFTFHVPLTGLSFRVRRRLEGTSDLPDWVWAAPPAAPGGHPTAGFLEAKGTYYRNQLLRSLDGAHTQLRQLTIEYRAANSVSWRSLQTKGWAVATGWATATPIERGFPNPILRVEDPIEDGAVWTEELAAAFFDCIWRLQMVQSLAGLGAPQRAIRILARVSRDKIAFPSDIGQRAGVWSVQTEEDGLRTIIGIEIKSITGATESLSVVAGIDKDAVELAESQEALRPEQRTTRLKEFVIASIKNARRLSDAE
jgi:hypothetical protein